MDYNLLIHNILFLFGGALNIVFPVVVTFIRRRKLDSLVITFVLMSWAVAVFQITQVLGANAPSATISRSIFMFNLTDLFINSFMTHWFLVLTGKIRDHFRRILLGFVYGSAAAILVSALVFPYYFLRDSVPKLYLPYYYVPGPIYYVLVAWFMIVGLYYFYELLSSYRAEKDPIQKNRYLYVLLAILYAFVLGTTAFLLVFNVPFDPMWSSFFGVYPLLIAYAVVRYQLLDVKLIIQRAFIYAALVSALIAIISFSNSLTEVLASRFVSFPRWIVPLISSLIGVGVGFLVWRKLRESDLLKYEFITVIAHKFRTPLTQTRWAAEDILSTVTDPETRRNLSYITQSNEKLVNLTGTLIELADTDSNVKDLYHFEKWSLCTLVQAVAESLSESLAKKRLSFSTECPPRDLFANVDREKISFVIQTLLENAVAYTPSGGKVSISITRTGGKGLVSVTDTGIGISKQDVPFIFSKFYRSHRARSADTEGFGVGLYLAQSIARRHGGRIEAYSQGEGQGSTFTLLLPLVAD